MNNQPSPACPPKARYAGIDAAALRLTARSLDDEWFSAPPMLSVFDRQLGVADDFLPPLGIPVDGLRCYSLSGISVQPSSCIHILR